MNDMADYNLNKITTRRSYNINEVAALFNIDRKTCQRWIKNEGLRVVDETERPLLVMGEALSDFIKNKRFKRKVPIKEDEFYCVKCHGAVKGKEGSEQTIKTGKLIGKDSNEQLKRIGICEHCGTPLNKFLRVCQRD